MHALDATPIWWRPEPVTSRPSGSQGSVAFAALVTFTAILLLSPQAWFPVLQHFRIAFLAAGVAIVVYLLECSVGRQAVGPLPREFVITLVLVLWAALTAPLSYWPGGSVEQLIDPFLKVVVFFWLVASLVTSYPAVAPLHVGAGPVLDSPLGVGTSELLGRQLSHLTGRLRAADHRLQRRRVRPRRKSQ